MKIFVLATLVLLASLNLQAQTNAPTADTAAVKAGEGAKAPVAQAVPQAAPETPARPRTTLAPAPAQKMPVKSEVRSQGESKTIQNLADSLAAQQPTTAGNTPRKTRGVLPSFTRAVKSGSNPFQLINPFAPLPKEESDTLTDHTHVLYDPKTQTGPALDFFSLDF